HKRFDFIVRGEYQDLVKALTAMQALPKSVSVNQYNVALVNKAGVGDGKNSGSLLELKFSLSITFLTGGGGGGGGAVTSALGGPWLAWWLGASAEAAALAPTQLDSAALEGGALVVKTHGGTPRFHVLGGNAHQLVVELEEAAIAGRAARYA